MTRASSDFTTRAEVTEVIPPLGGSTWLLAQPLTPKSGGQWEPPEGLIITHRTKPEHLKQDRLAFLRRGWGMRFNFSSFLKANLEIILFLKHCERKSENPFSRGNC